MIDQTKTFDLSPLGRVGKTCLVLAFLVGGYGCFRLVDAVKLSVGGGTATARVFYMDCRAGNGSADSELDAWHKKARYSRKAYRTVVFQTARGERIVDQPCFSWHHIRRGNALISPKIIPVERAAQVLYDLEEPKRWVFDSGWSLWGFPVLCISTCLGWVFFTLAVGVGWILPPRLRFRVRTAPRPVAVGSVGLSAEQA